MPVSVSAGQNSGVISIAICKALETSGGTSRNRKQTIPNSRETQTPFKKNQRETRHRQQRRELRSDGFSTSDDQEIDGEIVQKHEEISPDQRIGQDRVVEPDIAEQRLTGDEQAAGIP